MLLGVKLGINTLRLNIKYTQEKQGQTEHPLPVSTNLSSVANSVAPRSSAITPIISCSRLLPAKHTSTVYTDLRTNGALITAQPLTKHTQLHHLYLSGAPTTVQPLTKRTQLHHLLFAHHAYICTLACYQPRQTSMCIHPPAHECTPTQTHPHSYVNTLPNPPTNECTHIHPPTCS